MREGRIEVVTAIAAAMLSLLIPTSAAHAAVESKRCAWWDLEGGEDTNLVIDAIGGKTTCKAAKAVGRAYLKSPSWHPAKLRAAGKTWRKIDQDDYNGGDDCANGNPPAFGGPYFSYKTTQYESRTRYGWLSVHLELRLGARGPRELLGHVTRPTIAPRCGPPCAGPLPDSGEALSAPAPRGTDRPTIARRARLARSPGFYDPALAVGDRRTSASRPPRPA